MGGEAQGAGKAHVDEGSQSEPCGRWTCHCPQLSTGDLAPWAVLVAPWAVLAAPWAVLAAPWAVLAARTRLFPPVPQLRLRAESMCSVRVVQWLLTLLIKTVFSVVHS